uniref:Uncharacterized protein n=1 Tax=Oryza glaberrima TaxID=4538 RepID=I1QFU9_ORYGL
MSYMAEDLEQPSSDRHGGGRTPAAAAAAAAGDRQKEPWERRRSKRPICADVCACFFTLIGIAAVVLVFVLAYKCFRTTCYKL